MTHCAELRNTIVGDGEKMTGRELAAQLGTTKRAVAARVSELRDRGYIIRSVEEVCPDGSVQYVYARGGASKALLAFARESMKHDGFIAPDYPR